MGILTSDGKQIDLYFAWQLYGVSGNYFFILGFTNRRVALKTLNLNYKLKFCFGGFEVFNFK